MSAPDLLKKRLAEWEVTYEHELEDAELSVWYDTFRDLRISDVLLENALRIVQSKAVRMPKPGHLTIAIEEARAERDKGSRSSVLEDLANTPHVSDLPASERVEMKQMFDRAVAEIIRDQIPKYPHARTWKDQKAETARQKQALAAVLSDANWAKAPEDPGTPLDAAAPEETPAPPPVGPDEIAPEDLAEEVPYKPTDEDVPL
jgi:hypothetical protein